MILIFMNVCCIYGVVWTGIFAHTSFIARSLGMTGININKSSHCIQIYLYVLIYQL